MHFLSLLSKQSGSGSPANSYTQTSSCNENTAKFFLILIVLATIGLIVFSVYCLIKDPKSRIFNPQKGTTEQSTSKSQEEQKVHKKICQLDQADLSKVNGFVDALLTAEKYNNIAPKNNEESD